ncbi:ATP-binding protein [Marinobacter nauticus]|uniref:AAA domain-containing protein n=1 Tax=Marinobacter nauticus TaxID=2743 RepID=A0A368V7R8_MARNT|nr:ATP-binding protein [Marinobacter nauticus]RBP75541.1 AAA domain-containing protein [Marinobacter nauticus]RCW36350.1 AAA domain-containing protein [Marinobacter nauticus]
MTNRVLLPRIDGFQLVGFQPIFTHRIEMTESDGPSVVLGGNGLGKTTIMQAIAYGLAGGTSKINNDENIWKWDHKYFHGRIDKGAIKSAFVEVSFSFGSYNYSLRRGFITEQVIAFRYGSEDWIESADDAHKAFVKAISESGNYKSEEDFAFIFHHLLYLPETRQLLAWDADAQLRTLMLLNQDILSESDFRRKRMEIKELDSAKRHIHVAIGKVRSQIEASKKTETTKEELSLSKSRAEKSALIEQLSSLTKKRIRLESKERDAIQELNGISVEVEKLREQAEEAEAYLALHLLHEHEKQNNLALNKLTSRGICPACGTKQKFLQDLALEYQHNHQCTLCGSDEPQEGTPQLSTLQSQLHEKIQAQKNIERDYLNLVAQLNVVKRKENEIEFKLSARWYKLSDVEQIEREDVVRMGENPHEQLMKLEEQELKLKRQLQKRRRELENDYADYVEKLGVRLDGLKISYQDYATRFLGTECSLDENTIGKPIKFKHYIPNFDGKTRPKPESCSEAQRFFLDIAFRMAVIDYACGTKEQGTTFVCETPETALDYSYINNVVDMFQTFMDRNHSLIVSSNVQHDSIAGRLVKESKSQKKANIINLLELGQLSDVQKKAKPELDAIVQQIMGEA